MKGDEKMQEDCIKAHKKSINHKLQIEKEPICGCFYCLKLFNPQEIVHWIPDQTGTAECPYCGVDSVIGTNSDYPLTVEFLKKMNEYWFH